PDSYALLHQPEEQEIWEIQPSQWRDKGEKIYGPNADIVYWPKNRYWELIKDITESTASLIHDPITRSQVSYLNRGGGSGKTIRAIRIFKDINIVVFTHTNALAKNDCKVKAQTWYSFFRWNGMGEWTPEHMEEKKFPQVVIWNEVICCGDDAQPPPFFGEMLYNWLKGHANYYEEALTDYRAKCPKLRELKKAMQRLEKEWTLSDRILSAHILSQRIAFQKYLELHQIKYPEIQIPLIYRPRDGRKQNCLKELVKNDIVYLPLNTLPDKFLKDILADKKVIDWELGYAMTIHTSQRMTLKSPQHVWIIDENLAWDNLIYLAVGRVEYLNQLIWVEAPPSPSEIAQEIEETKKKR
ncbi:31472_t:CDS:2, partial [Gigaspora margarita]